MNLKTVSLWWLFLLALFGVALAETAEYTGKVIADGDTLTLLVDHRQLKIRLAEIDTPERGQPYGSRARVVVVDPEEPLAACSSKVC